MKITINDKTYEAEKGQTVLQAALANDIYIPHLCYHAKTGATGKCRACIVEIEGVSGFNTSCSVPIKEGMVIKTKSDHAIQTL